MGTWNIPGPPLIAPLSLPFEIFPLSMVSAGRVPVCNQNLDLHRVRSVNEFRSKLGVHASSYLHSMLGVKRTCRLRSGVDRKNMNDK